MTVASWRHSRREGGSTIVTSEREDFVAAALAASGPADPAAAAVFMVAVHAPAALRRAADARRAVDDRDSRRALGDASQAIVALYLALAAAARYRELTGQPGPIGGGRLSELETALTHMRDAVMHWEDKAGRVSGSGIGVTDGEVFVVAPPGKVETTARLVGLTWNDFEDCALRLERWANAIRGDPGEISCS
jgi:hypothetical protein